MSKFLGLLLAFAVSCSLAMAVGFPWKQAVLLSVFAAYVTSTLIQVSFQVTTTAPLHTFEPYYVLIIPAWEQILADFTIVKKTEEDWLKFTAWCDGRALPNSWYSVLRNDKDGVLIYRGAEDGFSTVFDWNHEVTKRRARPYFSVDAASPEGFPYGVDFFVKQNSEVIELGLDVDSDWWQSVSGICPKPLEARAGLYGTRRIVLAKLPLREFNLYWNEIDYDSKNVDRTWKLVRENREKHGWKEIERDKDFPIHFQPLTIENKYFKVQHHSLS